MLLPFLGAVAATGLLRLVGGASLGPRLAGAGAAAGFLLAYAAVVGARGLPVPFGDHKILTLALLGMLAGILIDSEGWGGKWQRVVVIALGVSALGWIIGPEALRTDPGPERNLLVAYVAGAILVFVRITRVAGSAGTAPIQLAVAATGIAIVATGGGASGVGYLGLALAAATFGFVAWNVPDVRFAPGPALVLGVATPLLAMAGQLLVDEDASPVALALLLLVFFSEWIAGHIKISGGKITRPIVLAFSGLLVVALAVGVAQWTGV